MWRGDRVSIPPVVYSWVGGHFEGWQALLGWPAAAAAATTTRAGQQTRAPLGRNFFRRQREDPLSTLKKCRNPSSPRFLLPPVIINLSLPRWLTHPSLHGSHYTSQPPDMDSLFSYSWSETCILLDCLGNLSNCSSTSAFILTTAQILAQDLLSKASACSCSRRVSERILLFQLRYHNSDPSAFKASIFHRFTSLGLAQNTHTHKERSSLRLPPTNRSPKSKIKRCRAPNAAFRSSLRTSTTTRNDC
jgi:hypothetical protein